MNIAEDRARQVYPVRISLTSVTVPEDRDLNLDPDGGIRFQTHVTPGGDMGRTVSTQFPREEPASEPGSTGCESSAELQTVIFDGSVGLDEELILTVSAAAEEPDPGSGGVLRFRKVFSGNPESWPGSYPMDEPAEDPDVLIPWKLTFEVEVGSPESSETEDRERFEHVDHKRLAAEWELSRWGSPAPELVDEALEQAESLALSTAEMAPPPPELVELGQERPLLAAGEDHIDLEGVGNPSPEGSFGYASEAFHAAEGLAQDDDADIVLPLTHLEDVERHTIQLFHWDELAERWRRVARSAAHPTRDVVWGRTDLRGIFVAVGLPRNPATRLTACLFQTMQPVVEQARLAGISGLTDRICQLILCTPESWEGGLIQDADGGFDLAHVPEDFEHALDFVDQLRADPPSAGLDVDLPRAAGAAEPPRQLPAPRFSFGGAGDVCGRCTGVARQPPAVPPEGELYGRGRLATPWDRPGGVITVGPRGKTGWRSLGPTYPTCVIRDFAIHPDDSDILFAAAQLGGVWRSLDGGSSWSPRTDGLPNLNAYAVAVARKKATGDRHRVVYFGTRANALGKDFDLYASSDNGTSWQRRTAVASDEAWEIATGKDDAKLIYLAGDRGLHKSTDGGRSWTVKKVRVDGKEKINAHSLFDGKIFDVKLDPGDDKVVWIAARSQGILVSRDGGESWTTTTRGVAAFSGSGRIVLDIGQDGRGGRHGTDFVVAKTGTTVGYTTDGGAAWTVMPGSAGHGGGTQGGWCSGLAVCPADETFVTAGGWGVAATKNATDAAPAWSDVPGLYWAPWGAPQRTDEYHPDIQVIRFDPADPSRFFVGNDGGITRVDGSGQTPVRISDGINANRLFYLDVSQTGTYHIGASTYHVGIVRKMAGSHRWKYVEVAEGGLYRIDPRDSTLHFCSPWGVGLRRSTASGDQGSWRSVTLDVSGAGSSYAHQLELRPRGADVIWAGTFHDRIHFSTDRGKTFTPLQDAQGNHLLLDGTGAREAGVATIAFAPSDADVTYVGTRGGRLWTTGRGSTTSSGWSEVSSPPKAPIQPDPWRSQSLAAIAVHPRDPKTLTIGYGVTGEVNLYRSKDGGKTWKDATGAGKNLRLPRLPVVDIVIDPRNPLCVYVALQYGVYYTLDGGSWWQPCKLGLPSVPIAEMRYRKGSRELYVATAGRGVFYRSI